MLYWKQLLATVIAKHQRLHDNNQGDLAMSNPANKTKPRAKGINIEFYELEREPLYLTARETQCLIYIMRGLTLRETSNNVSLSVRTVEFYFSNIKKKIGCRKKSEVIALLLASNFNKKIQ